MRIRDVIYSFTASLTALKAVTLMKAARPIRARPFGSGFCSSLRSLPSP